MATFRFSGFCTRLRKAVKNWDVNKVYIAKVSGLSQDLKVEVVLYGETGLITYVSKATSQEHVTFLAEKISEFLETGKFETVEEIA